MKDSSSEPTVFVVDDETLVRSSFERLVESMALHAECYASAHAFLEAFDPDRPGCLVSDIRLPGMSGLELQQRLQNRRVSLPIIFVTGYADVPTAVRAMKAGAVDFFEKPFNNQALLDAIWRAIELDRAARQRRAQAIDTDERLKLLSAREREVLKLVVAGRASKQIAASLGLSLKTVENHRASILEKLGANGVVHLVRLVLAHEEWAGADPTGR